MRTAGSSRDTSPLMRQYISLQLAIIMLAPLCNAVKDCWDFQGANSKAEVVERAKGSSQFALFSNSIITQPPSNTGTLVMASGPILTNLTVVTNTDKNVSEIPGNSMHVTFFMLAYR